MVSANSYLHEDAINGEPLTLAVNQPRASVGGGNLAQRLRAFERESRVRCLLLQDDLVWGTSRPATVVGPQLLRWPLQRAALVCWPLDQAVYLAEVDVAGFALIKDGTESVVGAEAAMGRLEAAMGELELVVVPGGRQLATLERAGYPPSSPDDYRLAAGGAFATQAAARLFLRERLVHRQHLAAGLAALAVAGLAFLMLPSSSGGLEEGALRVVAVPVPKGTPSLSGDLLALGKALRTTSGLRLHGLAAADYDSSERVLALAGRVAAGSAGRVGQMAEALGAERLAVPPPGWALRYPVLREGKAAQPQDLMPIDAELESLRTLTERFGFGAKATIAEAGLPGQRYAIAEIKLDSKSSGVARVLALASALAAEARQPNARLVLGKATVGKDQSLGVSLTVEARGALP